MNSNKSAERNRNPVSLGAPTTGSRLLGQHMQPAFIDTHADRTATYTCEHAKQAHRTITQVLTLTAGHIAIPHLQRSICARRKLSRTVIHPATATGEIHAVQRVDKTSRRKEGPLCKEGKSSPLRHRGPGEISIFPVEYSAALETAAGFTLSLPLPSRDGNCKPSPLGGRGKGEGVFGDLKYPAHFKARDYIAPDRP